MPDEALLNCLADRKVLALAYSASSAYVLRESFRLTRALEAFKGRADLAPRILEQLEAVKAKERDSVLLGAHLYALELAGGRRESAKGLAAILGEPRLRANDLIGQFAGHQAMRLLGGAGAERDRKNPDSYVDPKDLESMAGELRREGGLK